MRRHRHKLVPAGLTYVAPLVAGVLSGQFTQTAILFRCDDVHGPDCVTVKIVAGRWDMHDLNVLPRTWPDELRPDDTRDDLDPAFITDRLARNVPAASGGMIQLKDGSVINGNTGRHEWPGFSDRVTHDIGGCKDCIPAATDD